ncbi:MAG: hypothetical protein HYX59_13720 [Elusimicrobia bacterium]|nr:hypothetical protein [Elusimicrobiota bacterium]
MYRRAPLVLAALMFALPAAAQFSLKEIKAAQKDPNVYTLDEMSVEIVKVGPSVSPTEVDAPDPGVGDAIPVLDSIVNLGEKIWKIVKDNAPVVNVKVQYASALPEGIKTWTQMGGWSRPKGTIYELTAKNAYGMRVIKLRYQVLRTAGGSYKGTGKYLTAVTVEPLLVEAAWGYRLNVDANVPDSTIVNVGTSEAPIAAMSPQLGWTIATALKESQGKSIYYLEGNGAFQEVGGPFRREGLDKAKAAIAKTMEETLPSKM